MRGEFETEWGMGDKGVERRGEIDKRNIHETTKFLTINLPCFSFTKDITISYKILPLPKQHVNLLHVDFLILD